MPARHRFRDYLFSKKCRKGSKQQRHPSSMRCAHGATRRVSIPIPFSRNLCSRNSPAAMQGRRQRMAGCPEGHEAIGIGRQSGPLPQSFDRIGTFNHIVASTGQSIFRGRCTFGDEPHIFQQGQVEPDFRPAMALGFAGALLDVFAALGRLFMILHEGQYRTENLNVPAHVDLQCGP